MTDDTHESNTGTAELYGPRPESDYYWYPSRDWIALCEDLRDRDRTVYGVLRSLVIEDRRRGFVQATRVLSLDMLCALIPGVNGRPTGLGGLRDSLRRLGHVGLVSDPDGHPLTTSSSPKAAARALRIRIHDTPCNGYQPRWTSTEAKMRALQSGCDGNQTGSSGCDGNQVGCDGNQVGCDGNQVGCDGNQDSATDQGRRDPYTPSYYRNSSHPPLTGAMEDSSNTGSTVVEVEEEGEEIPEDSNNGDNPLVVDMIGRLPGDVTVIKRRRLVEQAAGLVAAGWGISALERELRSDLRGVQSHYAVYRSRMTELADAAPVTDVAAEVDTAAPAPRFDVELVDLRQDAAEAARDIAAPGSNTLGRMDFWIKQASKSALTAFIADPSLSVLEADEAAAPSRATQIHTAAVALADNLTAA